MGVRKPYVGGNWKMNLNKAQAVALAQELVQRFKDSSQVQVAVCVPFVYLTAVGEVLRNHPQTAILLGAQDCYHKPDGAFTGQISLSMLADVGVQVVLVGHSERRHVMGESDELINHKARAALDAGFDIILCVGEKLDQRQLEQTDAINAAQVHYGLAGVDRQQMQRVTIAYEPVWAIGTGKTATSEDAQKAHVAIRRALAQMFDDDVAQSVRIQYGGSVKPSNAGELFDQADIDGGLIGGASLKSNDFLAILEAAAATATAKA